jgi:hypothetical protein
VAASIQAKLHEAGWPASLTANWHWYQHDLVKNPRPLTDAGNATFFFAGFES